MDHLVVAKMPRVAGGNKAGRLNFSTRVLVEVVKILLFYIEKGAELVRLVSTQARRLCCHAFTTNTSLLWPGFLCSGCHWLHLEDWEHLCMKKGIFARGLASCLKNCPLRRLSLRRQRAELKLLPYLGRGKGTRNAIWSISLLPMHTLFVANPLGIGP